MDRRTFLRRSALLAAGGFLAAMSPTLAEAAVKAVNNGSLSFDSEATNDSKIRNSSTIPTYVGGGTETRSRPMN